MARDTLGQPRLRPACPRTIFRAVDYFSGLLKDGKYRQLWSEGCYAAIRGTVNKMPGLLRMLSPAYDDPECLPIDVLEVDAVLLPYLMWEKDLPPGSGIEDARSLYRTWSNYRSFCNGIVKQTGLRADAVSFDNETEELLGRLVGQHEAPAVYSHYEILPLARLAKEAAARRRTLRDLNAANVSDLAEAAPKARATILKALQRLDALHGHEDVPAHLLPQQRIGSIRRALLQNFLPEGFTSRILALDGWHDEACTPRLSHDELVCL